MFKENVRIFLAENHDDTWISDTSVIAVNNDAGFITTLEFSNDVIVRIVTSDINVRNIKRREITEYINELNERLEFNNKFLSDLSEYIITLIPVIESQDPTIATQRFRTECLRFVSDDIFSKLNLKYK